jgi:hypothetical protein
MSKAILELGKRHAKLSHVNIREEKHGDDSVPAIDIKLTEIMLEREDLNALLAEKHAHAALFNQAKAGTLIEPVFKRFAAFQFTEKFVECSATLYLGLGDDEGRELEDVTLARISLQPLSGGQTQMTITLQHELDDSDILSTLGDQLGRECSVELTFGKIDEQEKRQGKLALNSTDKPLNRHGEGESTETAH